MIYILVFLYVTLMYLKYILWDLGEDKIKPLGVLPIGLLVGSFSIFLVHLISPHNFIGYLDGNVIFFQYNGLISEIKASWKFDHFYHLLISNYVYTGMIEEISKFSAGFLILFVYNKTKMSNLFLYVVLSAAFFAFIENIHYLQNYGPIVVVGRSIFSTTTHICLGLISGFFIVKAVNQNKFSNSILVSLVGLILTSFLHGSFNLSIDLESEFWQYCTWVITVILGVLSIQKVKKYL